MGSGQKKIQISFIFFPENMSGWDSCWKHNVFFYGFMWKKFTGPGRFVGSGNGDLYDYCFHDPEGRNKRVKRLFIKSILFAPNKIMAMKM